MGLKHLGPEICSKSAFGRDMRPFRIFWVQGRCQKGALGTSRWDLSLVYWVLRAQSSR